MPLPQVVAAALSIHLERFPPGEDGILFTTQFGSPYRHGYYGTRIFAEAVPRGGLPKVDHVTRPEAHYASVLLAQGESAIAAAERLGYHNAALVLSTYGHLTPYWQDRTRRAVDTAGAACAARASHEEVAGR